MIVHIDETDAFVIWYLYVEYSQAHLKLIIRKQFYEKYYTGSKNNKCVA
jgi:hypothetical protein